MLQTQAKMDAQNIDAVNIHMPINFLIKNIASFYWIK